MQERERDIRQRKSAVTSAHGAWVLSCVECGVLEVRVGQRVPPQPREWD